MSEKQWFRTFNDYAEIIGKDEQKKAKLLHFHLRDHALAYYDSFSSDKETLMLTGRFSGDHGFNDMNLLSLQQQLN